MKRRWTKGILALIVVGFLAGVGLLIRASWPTSGTLVGDASQSDIKGMKRSLFLGADINGYAMWGWHRENRGDTPLTAAVQHGEPEAVRFLLTRGADPNQRDGGGMPPICWAAIHGRLDVSKALVEAGAKADLPDLDYRGNPEKTAIEYALEGGYREVAEYLESNGARTDPE